MRCDSLRPSGLSPWTRSPLCRGCGDALRDVDLRQLPGSLLSFIAGANPQLSDCVGELLAAATPALRRLELPDCHGLTAAAFPGLLQLRELQWLDLSRCKGLTATPTAAGSCAPCLGCRP